MAPTIGINEFARDRHKPERPYAHFTGTYSELVKRVKDNFHLQKPGYRDGVILVPVSPREFYTGNVLVEEDTELRAIFEARRKGEDPFVQVLAKGKKPMASYVDIVLYRKDVLDENNESTEGTDWEIVSVNAREIEREEPIPPLTMARNFLELTGGTKGEYTADEFAESIVYWSKRAKIDHED